MNEITQILKPKSREEIQDHFFEVIKPSNYYSLLAQYRELGISVNVMDERNLLIFRIQDKMAFRYNITPGTVIDHNGTWGPSKFLYFDVSIGRRIVVFFQSDSKGVWAVVTPHKKMRKIRKNGESGYIIEN